MLDVFYFLEYECTCSSILSSSMLECLYFSCQGLCSLISSDTAARVSLISAKGARYFPISEHSEKRLQYIPALVFLANQRSVYKYVIIYIVYKLMVSNVAAFNVMGLASFFWEFQPKQYMPFLYFYVSEEKYLRIHEIKVHNLLFLDFKKSPI